MFWKIHSILGNYSILVFSAVLFLLILPACSNGVIEEDEAPQKIDESNFSPRISGYKYELKQLSYQPGLKQLVCITGRKCDAPVTLQVLKNGKPQSGEIVQFRLIYKPYDTEGSKLSAYRLVSDDEGIVKAYLTPGKGEGDYVIGAYVHGNISQGEPLMTRVKTLRPGWIVFLIMGLLGGLAIFIFGMNHAGDNLQRALGKRMRIVLGKMTKNRFMAMVSGALASGVLQSSSAATVILVGFVSGTMMKLSQAIGAILGVKIGTSITVQLISFNISEYSLGIVAVGFLLMVMGRKERVKQVGSVLLGFGLIFFGMAVMAIAMHPLRGMPEFAGLLLRFSENTLLALLAGVLFTAIIQSSGATIGLVIALASENFLSLPGAVAISLGAAIGTCATALLASLGSSRSGKRVAVAHLLFSMISAFAILPFLDPFMDFAKWFTEITGGGEVLVRQIANAFTIYSIIAGLMFLPFVKPLKRLVVKLVPYSKGEIPFSPLYISNASLSMPAMALDQAKREIERMMSIFDDNLHDTYDAMKHTDEQHLDSIIAEDEKLDVLEKAVRLFVAKIVGQNLSSETARRERALIYISSHIEAAGDLLTKEVLHAAVKLVSKECRFSPEGFKDIKKFHHMVYRKCQKVEQTIVDWDKEQATKIVQKSAKEADLERDMRDNHLQRLHCGSTETVLSSSAHMSVIAALLGISEKLTAICEEIIMECEE